MQGDGTVTIPLVLASETGLELRALGAADADHIFLVVQDNREHLREWLPWVDKTFTSEDTRKFLASVEAGRKEGRTLAYGVYEDGEFRGVAGVHDIDMAERSAMIGYWLAAGARGRGLMTRSTRLLLALLFGTLGLERVEIRCAEGNRASAAIPERLGFQFEGVRRHGQFLNGGFVNLRCYSLLREEWLASAENVESGL